MLRGMFSEIRERLEAGYTLPAGWYSDSAILALERERIFKHTWQYACVTAAGERARRLLRHQGRDHPGRPRPGQGGRAQGLRQRLPPSRPRRHAGLRAPRDAAVPLPRLDVRARRLPAQGAALRARARVRRRQLLALPRPGGHVGAVHLRERRPRGRTRSAETLGVLPETVAETGIDLDSLKFHHRGEYVIEANWKIAVENYLECYHCPVAHPGFSSVIDVDPDAYALASSGYVSTQKGPVRSLRRSRARRRRPTTRPARSTAARRSSSSRTSPSTSSRARRT